MRDDPEVPEAVRQKAAVLGQPGERWLRELGGSIAQLEVEWGIAVGATRAGGTSGYVADARTETGRDAVLKLAIPDGLEGNSPFTCELETLLIGSPTFVEVLRFDRPRRALLVERLGPALADLGLTVEAQIRAIVATLIPVWRPVRRVGSLRTGAAQARFLGAFVRSEWERLGRPCAQFTIERAETYARSRHDAFDAPASVLIHGDAHPGNVLESGDSATGFTLVDPDGMRSEPAHDLAIPLRDWTDELLAGNPVELGLAWCTELGERAGVAPEPIWEWAFVERVSTGLFLTRLGDTRGRRLLQVADEWAPARP